MNEPKLDGGSAQYGLSVRDYFAAKAMAAMRSDYDYMQKIIAREVEGTDATICSTVAKMAYAQADAMLEARK